MTPQKLLLQAIDIYQIVGSESNMLEVVLPGNEMSKISCFLPGDKIRLLIPGSDRIIEIVYT